MSQSESPYQSCPRKRQRQIRPVRFGPPLLPDRPQSAISTATSIDATKHPEAKESVGDGSERRGGSFLYNS
ncbi:hypothetical protein BFJ67_g17903 [Fusarium oxysporum f. sp. cepae]|nr:hypothetical protein BFJ67_g17903 [Fusarium oxysporum f. sp. cepae]